MQFNANRLELKRHDITFPSYFPPISTIYHILLNIRPGGEVNFPRNNAYTSGRMSAICLPTNARMLENGS